LKVLYWFLNVNYRFDLFRAEHWQYIWDQWNSGWAIKTIHEFILVATLLLCVPVWLIGAVLTLFINTKAVVSYIKRKYGEYKQRKMVKKAIADGKKPKKPEVKSGAIDQKLAVNSNEAKHAFNKKIGAMAVVVKKMKKKAPLKALEINQTAPRKAASPAVAPVPPPVEKPKDIARDEAFDEIGKVLYETGAGMYSKAKFNGNVTDFLVMAADKIGICIMGPDENELVADEDGFGDMAPVWFSEVTQMVSPVYVATKVAAFLKEKGAVYGVGENIKVVPFVVMWRGDVLNYDSMLDVWHEQGVEVVSFASSKNKELISLHNFLEKENFSNKMNQTTAENITKLFIATSEEAMVA